MIKEVVFVEEVEVVEKILNVGDQQGMKLLVHQSQAGGLLEQKAPRSKNLEKN